LVTEPGFNPNNRVRLPGPAFRNRAVTDTFEPGSTLKPFTVAAALESGRFRPDTTIDTSPGLVQIGTHTIRDERNHGLITVARVIEKSSNVGATKIALALNKNGLHETLQRFGFGAVTGSRLPGEAHGALTPAARWVPVEQATIAFGYGVSVTALQLARAYGALANDGVIRDLSLQRLDRPSAGRTVMSAATARQVRAMLEMAVGREGTGAAARVVHYRVAGKTGTVRKLVGGGYSEHNYIAAFAGFAPASAPRLVMVIMVDDPASGGYFGGQVAAPVFSRVMAGALRLLNIPPDETPGAAPVTAERPGRDPGART
jgi:cell division protein FtsI (penicillin-binding protein 3)